MVKKYHKLHKTKCNMVKTMHISMSLDVISNSTFLMKSEPQGNVIPTVYGARCIKRIAKETQHAPAMAARDKSLLKPYTLRTNLSATGDVVLERERSGCCSG